MNDHMDDNILERGSVLELVQRSARHREYALCHGDEMLGWLRFPPRRRSAATAWAGATGSRRLIASSGRVEIRGGPDAAVPVATVERARRGVAVLHPVGGPPLRWRRTGLGYRSRPETLTARRARREPRAVPSAASCGVARRSRVPRPRPVP